MRIGKTILLAAIIMIGQSPAQANGNLQSLVVELENINRLVALQEKHKNDDHERWVFRYDLLQQRINVLIADIEKHIELIEAMPKLERFDRD